MAEPALDAAGVRLGFRLMLRRVPEDEHVVAHYLSLGLTLPAFLGVLMESDEFMERQRRLLTRGDLALDKPAALAAAASSRVLLFGAFGNGNVGDAAQMDAVAALLRQMAPRQAPPAFAATSWERLAPFVTGQIQPLRPDALMRPEHIRPRSGPADGGGADLVVIGGGGLFGAPHFPLHERRWAEWFVGRGVPFALLGLGGSAEALATAGWREAYRLLLEHAIFVGLRDEETLQAARTIRPDATWFPDPVLAEALLAPHAPPHAGRDIDAVLIPRAPNDAADRTALAGLRAMAAACRAKGKSVVIAALEPAADRGALTDQTVQFVGDWAELMLLCGRARVVVSARLHGVVAGLASGCAVHGLAQPKTGDLLARLGLRDWFAPTGWPNPPPDVSPQAVALFHTTAAAGLASFRAATEMAQREAAQAMRPALRRWVRAPRRASPQVSRSISSTR